MYTISRLIYFIYFISDNLGACQVLGHVREARRGRAGQVVHCRVHRAGARALIVAVAYSRLPSMHGNREPAPVFVLVVWYSRSTFRA